MAKSVFVCSCFTGGFRLPHEAYQVDAGNGRGPRPARKKSHIIAPVSVSLPLRKRMEMVKVGRGAVEQSTSPLYSKLPAEIRTLIFEEVLFGEGNVVHIYKRRKTLLHHRCTSQFQNLPCTYSTPCSAALPYRARLHPHQSMNLSSANLARFYDASRFLLSPYAHSVAKPWSVVSLIRTCRMIYNEVAPMLYTKTHFHFPHPADLSLFSERVGQARLQSIRIMSFDVGDFDTGFSIEAAAQVKDGTALYSSGLNGLKELRVLVKKAVLEIRPGTLRGDDESVGGLVLGCDVKAREGLDVFQVVVPGCQYRVWESLLVGKKGVELCVYHDDSVPAEDEVATAEENGEEDVG